MKRHAILIALVALVGLASACQQTPNAQAAPAAPNAAAEKAKAPEQKPAVASIVFIGQKDCCDCTRARIDGSYQALTQVLGTPPSLPVTRLQIDLQEQEADKYLKQKPAQVMPAVYFLDAKGNILAMLQGELTAEQIKAKL